MQENSIIPSIVIPSIVNFLIALFTVIIGYLFVKKQIVAMEEIEKEKRIIAIQSLIFELEYNKALIGEYKEHSEVGNNLGKSGDSYSWEWNTPLFVNFPCLIQACYTDIKLAQKITFIYSKLWACEIIVKQVHHLIATNIQIREAIPNGKALLRNEVVKLNNQLWDIGGEIVNLFDEPIKNLTKIKMSL
ncbi:MAG: hypothetical protein WCY12_01445 [Candidatus Omnitrophota bacterium]